MPLPGYCRTQTGDVLALSKAYSLTDGNLRGPPIPGNAPEAARLLYLGFRSAGSILPKKLSGWRRHKHLGYGSRRVSDRLLWVAISIGRRNTLSENHCPAKMSLNQSNSQRFIGTPSSCPWEQWQPGEPLCTSPSPL